MTFDPVAPVTAAGAMTSSGSSSPMGGGGGSASPMAGGGGGAGGGGNWGGGGGGPIWGGGGEGGGGGGGGSGEPAGPIRGGGTEADGDGGVECENPACGRKRRCSIEVKCEKVRHKISGVPWGKLAGYVHCYIKVIDCSGAVRRWDSGPVYRKWGGGVATVDYLDLLANAEPADGMFPELIFDICKREFDCPEFSEIRESWCDCESAIDSFANEHMWRTEYEVAKNQTSNTMVGYVIAKCGMRDCVTSLAALSKLGWKAPGISKEMGDINYGIIEADLMREFRRLSARAGEMRRIAERRNG